MRDVLEHIVQSLVDNKNEIQITEIREGSLIKFKVKTASNDVGKVIGKGGKIAGYIRAVMQAIATVSNEKVVVDFE